MCPGTKKPSGTTIALSPKTSKGTIATLFGQVNEVVVFNLTGTRVEIVYALVAYITFGTI